MCTKTFRCGVLHVVGLDKCSHCYHNHGYCPLCARECWENVIAIITTVSRCHGSSRPLLHSGPVMVLVAE